MTQQPNHQDPAKPREGGPGYLPPQSPGRSVPAAGTAGRVEASRIPASERPVPTAAPPEKRVTRAGLVWVSVATALGSCAPDRYLQNQDYVQVRFLGLRGPCPWVWHCSLQQSPAEYWWPSQALHGSSSCAPRRTAVLRLSERPRSNSDARGQGAPVNSNPSSATQGSRFPSGASSSSSEMSGSTVLARSPSRDSRPVSSSFS